MNSTVRHWLHYVITGIIMLGGILTTNSLLLKIHIFICGNVILHWLTNNNRCIISEADYNNNNGYTIHLLQKMGIQVDESNSILPNLVAYGSVMVVLFFSWWRLKNVAHDDGDGGAN